jgi:hypothetical protein
MHKIQIEKCTNYKIDWNKNQYVQHIDKPDLIVNYLGEHDDMWFKGYVHPCDLYPLGKCSKFYKPEFKRFTGKATLIIENT